MLSFGFHTWIAQLMFHLLLLKYNLLYWLNKLLHCDSSFSSGVVHVTYPSVKPQEGVGLLKELNTHTHTCTHKGSLYMVTLGCSLSDEDLGFHSHSLS